MDEEAEEEEGEAAFADLEEEENGQLQASKSSKYSKNRDLKGREKWNETQQLQWLWFGICEFQLS